MTDPDIAAPWAEIHAATPHGWFVGRPGYVNTHGQWEHEPMAQRLGAIALVVLLAVLLVGCYTGDQRFHVRNETGQVWWIRVAIGGSWGDDQFWVSQVKPGADGVAFDWYGDTDSRVELLDEACAVVGVFARDPEGVYRVPEVSGITGTVTAIGRQVPRPSLDDDLISRDGRCNGTILM
jgi:hypothetical protein